MPILISLYFSSNKLDIQPFCKKENSPFIGFYLEFWEDDEEIRMEDERAWFIFGRKMRARNGIEQVFRAGENYAWFLITLQNSFLKS